MPKASPLLHGFNAGEFSPLMEGRTDLDKYPSSMRTMRNTLPTPQGPAMRRSGTKLHAPIYDEALNSYFVPFIFSNEIGQIWLLELANGRIRFHNETGIQAYAPVVVTASANAAGFLKLTAAGHAAIVGSQVVLAGFEFAKNLNARIVNVTAVAGDDITFDLVYPAGGPGGLATATVARVYHIAAPYVSADVEKVRYTGDANVLYLFCDGYAPQKLTRVSAYDWRLVQIEFIDGPYDNINETNTRLSITATGTVIPEMSAASTPSGTASADTEAGGHAAWGGFNTNDGDYWSSTTDQSGTLQYQFDAPETVTGYSIEIPKSSNDGDYKSTDYAPSTWRFEASGDGVTWTLLDAKTNYVLYSGQRSLYFKTKNATAYVYYRIVIRALVRNGPIQPRISRLVMTTALSILITVDASSATGINQDQGFLATDVGRSLRMEGQDANWRPMIITGRNSATQVTVRLQADAFDHPTVNTAEWRLGLFSVTTGYPTCATFFEDRLIYGGMSGYPDWLAMSVPGKYETISQTDPDGTVNDDNGVVVRLNARRLGRVGWLASDNRSLLVGTGAGEWQVSSADLQSALSARTAKARRASSRGAAEIEPVLVDRQLLYVQRGGRTIREMAYSFDIDGYKTPSMNLFASHLGRHVFKQIDFAMEPLAVAWIRGNDGTLLGLTYNREENVIGWHVHDVGGLVKAIAVLPGADGKQDLLWLIVERVVGGVTRRFIEIMQSVWDFDSTLDTAHFVDCGIRYQGAPIGKIYGLYHLEGQRLCGLADGSPIVPQTVVSGTITLPESVTASNILLGVGYDSLGETSRLEAGAGDGTAQGKTKRIHGAVVRLWQSGGGQVGTRTSDDVLDEAALEAIDWLTPDTPMDEAPALFNGDTQMLRFGNGSNKSGTVIFKQPAEIPLPFNVVAIMPTVNTQDR